MSVANIIPIRIILTLAISFDCNIASGIHPESTIWRRSSSEKIITNQNVMDPIIGPQIEAAPPSIKTVQIKNVVCGQNCCVSTKPMSKARTMPANEAITPPIMRL